MTIHPLLLLLGFLVGWFYKPIWHAIGYTALNCLAYVGPQKMYLRPLTLLRSVFYDWPRVGWTDSALGNGMLYRHGSWEWKPPFGFRRLEKNQ